MCVHVQRITSRIRDKYQDGKYWLTTEREYDITLYTTGLRFTDYTYFSTNVVIYKHSQIANHWARNTALTFFLKQMHLEILI